MNIKDYRYLVSIAEEQNIRKAADKNFITPSALTQKINLIEKELGVELFVRSNAGCIPTENGRIFIEAAKNILLIDDTARKQIQDTKDILTGELKVGLPPDRGGDMFLYIYPLFHEAYPSINITLIESSAGQLQKLIADGSIDLAIVGVHESQQTKDNYISIRKEEMLILVPENILPDKELQNGDVIDLNSLKDRPFAMVRKDSSMRQWQDRLFERHGFAPHVVFETAKASTILPIVSMGLCCSIVSDYYYNPSIKNIRFLRLADRPTWDLSALYNANGYLTKPAKYFIRLAKQFSDIVPVL